MKYNLYRIANEYMIDALAARESKLLPLVEEVIQRRPSLMLWTMIFTYPLLTGVRLIGYFLLALFLSPITGAIFDLQPLSIPAAWLFSLGVTMFLNMKEDITTYISVQKYRKEKK